MVTRVLRSWPPLLALVVLLSLAPGCTCLGNEIAMRREQEWAAVPTKAESPGGPWKSATVMRHVKKTTGGGRDPFNYWWVRYQLSLKGGPNGGAALDLEGISEQHDGIDAARAALGWTFEIRFASDGHALVVRRSDADAWTYVALDAGAQPFACSHWPIEADEGEDPFLGAPTTRDILQDVLDAADGAEDAHHSSGSANHLEEGVAWACAHEGEEPMRARFAKELAKKWGEKDTEGWLCEDAGKVPK